MWSPQVDRQAGDLVAAGKSDEAQQRVEELNGWLRASNQFERWGIAADTSVPAQQTGGRWQEIGVAAALQWSGHAGSTQATGTQATGGN